MFARQLLNVDSDISGSESDRSASKVFIVAMERRGFRKDMEEVCRSDGFPAMQRLPKHILTFLANFHGEFRLTGNLSAVSLSLWPAELQSYFYGTDPKVMLAHECCVLGVQRRPSTIKHDFSGMGLFAGRDFGKHEIIGCYYGSLLYIDLNSSANSRKTVGNGFMKVNSKIFGKWALEITDAGGMNWRNKKLIIWIVPRPVCAMRYINDPR